MAPKKKPADSPGDLSDYDDEFMDEDSEDYSDDSGEYDEDEKDTEVKQSECIRRVSNFSAIKPHDILDKKVFNPDYLKFRMKRATPKLTHLLNLIDQLDRQDIEKHGRLYKHMIFTDQQSSAYGIKIVLSTLIANGFQLGFHSQGKGFHLLDKGEQSNPKDKKTVGALFSKTMFQRPMSVPFKKSLLDRFNKRPENVHGDLMRFIVLDQGFKEGIDLYDVKYCHLLEPLLIPADEKQAIGRSTRFCGQRGLVFNPTFGWPLYVFKYDVQTGSPRTPTFHDLYLQYAALDLRKIAFAAEIETQTIEGAVDATLTYAIHNFSIPPPSPILKSASAYYSAAAGVSGTSGGAPSQPPPPPKKLDHKAMTTYIQLHYKDRFTYDNIKLQNNCQDGGAPAATGGAPKAKAAAAAVTDDKKAIVQFTPTQDFIRHYFTPASPYKGMLLWHSVGTGKTCTAIATATHSFEPEGYTILWVTRHTLKSDIFKNMFRQVCSLVIQKKLMAGEMKLPTKLSGPMKYLSDRWITPISYKQFTNLLLKKNKFYQEMVKRNGSTDPLRKTLLIIDEAHKLYSPGVAASERPNTDILETMLQNSYKTSGTDSVRLLVMTATPYTEDGMEMVKLLNLLREPKDQFPTDFEDFAKGYLSPDGFFTIAGKRRWMNNIAGYVSYLNRSKDARNFAYPVLTQIQVPMSKALDEKEENPEDGIWEKYKAGKEQMKIAKKDLRESKKNTKALFKDGAKEAKQECLEAVKAEMEAAKKVLAAAKEACKEAGKPADKKQCREKADAEYKATQEVLKKKKDGCKDANNAQQDLEDTLAGIEEEFNEAHAEYLKLEKLTKQFAAERKETNKKLKELKPVFIPLRLDYKNALIRFKNARKAASKILDKSKQKAEYKRIRETEGAVLKESKEAYIDMKDTITNLRLKNKVNRLQQGSTTVGDISQEKILEKRCKVSV